MGQYESWKTRERREPPKTTNADRISDLPDFILHGILSRLCSQAEVTRTRVLSTRWNTIAASFPEVEFHQSRHFNPYNRNHQAQCRRFTSCVRESLSRFLSLNLRIHRFSLELENLNDNDPELPSSVDSWIGPVLRSGAAEITLSVSVNRLEEIFYSLPETTFQGQNFSFLQKLDLSHVTISEQIISDIVRNCRNLSAIRLFQCRGFETVAIAGLKKLEKVEIHAYLELKKVEIFAESLQTFRLSLPSLMMKNGSQCKVTLGPCPNLRELALSNLSLKDRWFQTNLISQQLEELEIVDCHELNIVKIPALKNLRSLRVIGCDNIERIELDSPNLNDFMLHCYKIPVLVTNTDNAKCEQLNVGFWPRDNVFPVDNVFPLDNVFPFDNVFPVDNVFPFDNVFPVDSSWFGRLRQFLGLRNIQTKIVTLKLVLNVNKVTFDREELRELKIPEPPHEIEEMVLCLGKKATSVECGALIDGLLWSCHPKKISIDKHSSSLQDIIKVFREKQESSNWRHEIKSVEIISPRRYKLSWGSR